MGGEKYNSMLGDGVGVVGMGCGGGWGGGIYCLLGCSCQVNILQCTLDGVETVVGKYIRLEKSCIYNSHGRWIFVCICVGGWILFGCVRV